MLKMLKSGVFLGVSVSLISAAPVAGAEPFNPAEVKYLNDVHMALQPEPDAPQASWSDTRLVGEGWFACHDHAIGVSLPQAGISPIIGTYALLDLCPNGCPQGCLHRG